MATEQQKYTPEQIREMEIEVARDLVGWQHNPNLSSFRWITPSGERKPEPPSYASDPMAFSELLDVLAGKCNLSGIEKCDGKWKGYYDDGIRADYAIAATKELALLIAAHAYAQELKKQTTPEANGN